MIPIIILSKERPLQLAEMVRRIEDNTDDYLLIICDNGSLDYDMMDLLQTLEEKHTVIYNKDNLCFSGFNPGLKLIEHMGFKFFFLSDPDIFIKDGTPKNWPHQLVDIMVAADSPKVGIGLDSDFEASNNGLLTIKETLKTWTSETTVLDQKCTVYGADTTMAAHRIDSMACWKDGDLRFGTGHGLGNEGDRYVLPDYNPKYKGPALMTKDPLVAYHAPWTFFDKYNEEQIRYLKLSNKYMSSMYYNLKDHYESRINQ